MLYEVITDHGQPEARALVLGGEEGVEDFRQVVRRDAHAAVVHGQGHAAARVITSYSIHYTKLYEPGRRSPKCSDAARRPGTAGIPARCPR